MELLISDAMAQAAGGAGPQGGFMSFLSLIILFVAFYFLLIRPQMKRQREHQKLVEGLQKGDEVVTSGGLLGRINDVGDVYVKVEVARGVEVRIQRPAVSAVLPKGTLKEI
jgi:preprotein translocase subunit YajC